MNIWSNLFNFDINYIEGKLNVSYTSGLVSVPHPLTSEEYREDSVTLLAAASERRS
jgi:hypothetical protein